MRTLEPRLYDTQLQRWEEGADEAFVPVDPMVDRDIHDIQIAEVLHVPAPLVRALPMHWVGSALVLLESRALIHEKQAAKRKRK